MTKEQAMVLRSGTMLSFTKRPVGSRFGECYGYEAFADKYGETVNFVGFIPADSYDSYALVIQGQTVQGDALGLPTLRVGTKVGQGNFSATWFE
jgi:hypothetical protein